MQIYVLDTELHPVTMIDYAESVLWFKKYNDVGEAEIYLQCDEEVLSLLQRDYYLYRYDDDMFCQIKKIHIVENAENGDYLTVTAVDGAKDILSGRIVWNTINFKGTVPEFIRRVLNENIIDPADRSRQIPNFVIDDDNFSELTDRISIQCTHDDILQLIISTCKAYNYGFRVFLDLDIGCFVFRLFKGVDRSKTTGESYVEFSEDYANILSTNYEYDSGTQKNFVLIAGQGEGSERAYATIGTATGRNRLELFVDARDISKTYQDENGVEQTYSDEEYEALLLERGWSKLAEYMATETFSGEVDASDSYIYKEDYNIGDIVAVKNSYGITAAARITEIDESEDDESGYVVEPIFEWNSQGG